MEQISSPSFQRERASTDLFEEMLPLFTSQHEEVFPFKDIPIEFNLDTYFAHEQFGSLRIFTARDLEKRLLGYALFFVNPHLRYKSSLQSVQDIIYVSPQHRGFGGTFISWCDEELKKEGVEVVYHHVKKSHNFGPMLERKGYELVDLVYGRRLN